MSDKEANDIRNIAHDIIIRLMDAGRITALTLLEQHTTAALTECRRRGTSEEGIDE